MFSKKLLAIAMVVATASGCSLPVNEEPPKQNPQKADLGAGSQCLSRVLPVLEGFIQGSALPEQVGGMWDCFNSAIRTFEKSTHGRYEDRFTARELANFVERYFMDNKKIADPLLTEVFRLKQLFVGGEIDSVTRTEMNLLISTSTQLKTISLGILPYMKIFSFNWQIGTYKTLEQDVRYFEAANLQIQVAAKDIAAIIEKNGRGYVLNNLVVLLEEISKVSDEPFTWIEDFKNLMPVVQKLKRTLSGGSENTIEPMEWRRFALLGARGYVQYLRYYYFIKKVDQVGTGPELVYLARSIDDLFSYLGDMVAGKPEGVFTRAELKEVLESLGKFLPDIHVTDKFLVEVMKVKQLIFGGSLDNFTPADFERARTKIDSFRALTEKLFSYVAVYGLSWNPLEMSKPDAQTYFEAAEKNLAEFGRILGQLIETQYDLKDLKVLADEVDKFYPPMSEDGKTFKELADQVVPLAVAAKNIIFTDENSTVTKDQWPDLLGVGAGFYARFMYYYYFLKDQEFTRGDGINNLEKMVNQSADFLDMLIARKPGNPLPTIRFEELDRLVDGAIDGKLFPEKLSAKTVKNLIRVVIQKMLIAPERRLKGDPLFGLTREATQVIRSEFKIWLSNQRFLDHIYSNVAQDAGLPGSKIQSELANVEQTEAIKELVMIFNTPIPMTNDSEGRLHLSKAGIDYSRGTVAKLNLARMVVRLIIRGYAMDLKRVYSYQGVSLDEANQLFVDVKPFVTELGLIDPRNDTFADSRFREANLFTARANGNEYLEFNEATDLFMLIFSGVTVNGILYEKLEKECPMDKTPVYKDDWTVSMSCLLNLYRRELPAAYAAMPEFVAFLNKLSKESYEEVMVNLLKAAGYIPNANGKIKIGDASLAPHVTQYVETVIQQFDKNRDGVLSNSEAMKAYPRFRKILQDLSGFDKEKRIQALFAWIIKYGKPPETVGEKASFLWWSMKDESSWDGSAGRQKFAGILGFIADATAKEAKKNPKKKPTSVIQPGILSVDENIDDASDEEIKKVVSNLTQEERNRYCSTLRDRHINRKLCGR